MARTPRALVRGGQVRCREFLAEHQPTVICEPVVSGNDYRMAAQARVDDEIWQSVPTGRAYDMEAAGFALAAANNGVQWLVVRGISDHGTPATKSDFHRAVAAGIAARFLAEFLEHGLVRAARLPLGIEPAVTIPRLRDEAYRLDGRWVGAMAYRDNDGEPVIFAEEAEFTQDGLNVSGLVRSQRITGNSRHEDLEYQVTFSIAKHGYAGGYWSETIAARKYFGVMMGRFLDESTVLAGTWHGTSNAGVRQGYFKWYNTDRDGARVLQDVDLEQVSEDLVRTFREQSLGRHADSCWVAS
jgi:hypothetical protein